MSRTIARWILILMSALLVASLACPVSAQSGRRPPPRRTETTPAPAETTPAPEPAPTVASEPEASAIPISAGTYVSNFNLPSSIADYVYRACVDRFKSAKGFKLLPAGEINRKKAADLAKTATDTYVLLMEFSIDAADPGRMTVTTNDLRNTIVQYTLFTPKTGKVRTQGRLYFDASQYYAHNGGVLGTYSRLGRSGNYTPDQAGQKVAEYVMDSLLQTNGGEVHGPRG